MNCWLMSPFLWCRLLTTKQLRGLIAGEIGCDEDSLDTDRVRMFLDDLILQNLARDGEPPVLGEFRDKPVKKRKASKSVPEKRKTESSDADEEKLTRLKGYVHKCGVRRVWKRELEGMSTKQAITHVEEVLRVLGVEGRPTFEKCSAVKERREFEEELKAVQENTVLPNRLRSHKGNSCENRGDRENKDNRGNSDEEGIMVAPRKMTKLDLSAFGDSESE